MEPNSKKDKYSNLPPNLFYKYTLQPTYISNNIIFYFLHIKFLAYTKEMGKEKDLSNIMKGEILQFLLSHSKNGHLPRGKKGEAAALFNCSNKTVGRLWKSAEDQLQRGEVIEVANKRCGRERKLIHEFDADKIQSVNYQKRGTIRDLSKAIGVPKSIVGRWVKMKLIRAHSNAIKPALTAPNKLLRLNFSLQAIHYDDLANVLKFKPMENIIHIDEKWFYLTKKTNKYYMTPLEDDPYRTCQSKKFIPKVMFMCAVCRPIFHENGSVIFDGKIGMWPFTEAVAAKRDSKKRKRGTLEIKPIQSITKEVIRDCLINQVKKIEFYECNACNFSIILIEPITYVPV